MTLGGLWGPIIGKKAKRKVKSGHDDKGERTLAGEGCPVVGRAARFTKPCGVYREEREPKVARAADTRRLAICSVR
jgi:hypothetical protein